MYYQHTPFTQYIGSGGVDIVCVCRVSSVLSEINEVCLRIIATEQYIVPAVVEE